MCLVAGRTSNKLRMPVEEKVMLWFKSPTLTAGYGLEQILTSAINQWRKRKY